MDRLVRTFSGDNSKPISCVAVSLDAAHILSGSGFGTDGVNLWNLNSGDLLHTFALSGAGGASSVAFSPDGRVAAAASSDSLIVMWDTQAFSKLGVVPPGIGSLTSNQVAFAPNGQLVLSAAQLTVTLYDMSLHQKSTARVAPGEALSAVAFSPEGRFVAGGAARLTPGDDIVVLDLLSGQQTLHFSGHPGYGVMSIAWSGNNILSGSADRSLKLWNSTSGAAIRAFAGHTGPVESVALDSGGTLALSGSDDGTMKLWAVASGAVLQTFDHADGPVIGVAFASGARFAVSGGGKTLKLWDLSGLAP
jgi:WD40 repeat protein